MVQLNSQKQQILFKYQFLLGWTKLFIIFLQTSQFREQSACGVGRRTSIRPQREEQQRASHSPCRLPEPGFGLEKFERIDAGSDSRSAWAASGYDGRTGSDSRTGISEPRRSRPQFGRNWSGQFFFKFYLNCCLVEGFIISLKFFFQNKTK